MSSALNPDSTFNPREPIPGYVTRELIGRGGFGEVWSAEAPGGLAKAIKIVHAGVDSSRAERELRSLQRIRDVRHPLILSVERIEIIAGTLVIVTELADCSLRELFKTFRDKQQPGLPREQLLAMLPQPSAQPGRAGALRVGHPGPRPNSLIPRVHRHNRRGSRVGQRPGRGLLVHPPADQPIACTAPARGDPTKRGNVARIEGVDLPRNKPIWIALTYIYGVGQATARKVVDQAGVNGMARVHELTDQEVAKLREVLTSQFNVEGELRKEVAMNIKRLIDMGSYRGLRHRRGLPVRGQRSKTNARTRKGPRKPVAGKKK